MAGSGESDAPGGFVEGATQLTISAVDNPPPPIQQSVRQTAVYDISIEGRTEFEQDIVLELPYAECGLSRTTRRSAGVGRVLRAVARVVDACQCDDGSGP